MLDTITITVERDSRDAVPLSERAIERLERRLWDACERAGVNPSEIDFSEDASR